MWYTDALKPSSLIAGLGMIASGYAFIKWQGEKVLRRVNQDLRDEVGDKDRQIADREKTIAQRDRDLAEARAEMAEKERDLIAVSKVVTGEAHWVVIEELMRDVLQRVQALMESVAMLMRKRP